MRCSGSVRGPDPGLEHVRIDVPTVLEDLPKRQQAGAAEQLAAPGVVAGRHLQQRETELSGGGRAETGVGCLSAFAQRAEGGVGIPGGCRSRAHGCLHDGTRGDAGPEASQVRLAHQEVEGALRHLGQPDQHGLALDLGSAQVLCEVAERAADDDVGRGVVRVVVVQVKGLLPVRGLLTAEPAGAGGRARLPLARPGVGGPGRGVGGQKQRKAGHGVGRLSCR